jgi:uncharacterized membrane protein
MMNTQTNNSMAWQNPNNWSRMGLFGVYFSKQDTRLWVRKAAPTLGWTINFGHRYSVLILAACMIAPVIFMLGVFAIIA